jgi:hypothetical protein
MRNYTVEFEDSTKEQVTAGCMSIFSGAVVFSRNEDDLKNGRFAALISPIQGRQVIKVTSELCKVKNANRKNGR